MSPTPHLDRPPQPVLEKVKGVTMLCLEHKNPHGLDWSRHSVKQSNKGKMTSLTEKDKATVKAFWAKIAGKKDDIGAEALGR